MATEKQIAANRRNAEKSTGPRTVEGKQRSSANARRSTGPRTSEGRAISARNAFQSTGPTSPEGKLTAAMNASRSTGPTSPEGKEIAAHNAALSTGPRTLDGKEIAAQNSITQGLWASATVVLRGENVADWITLRDGVLQRLAPDGPIEEELARRVATVLWRIRRIQRVEASLCAVGDEDARNFINIAMQYDAHIGGDMARLASPPEDVFEGRAWMRMAAQPDIWGAVTRSERALDRILWTTLAGLERLQQARRNPTGLHASFADLIPPEIVIDAEE